ncbi:MAG: hypothetical protein ACXVCY_04680 [Pseudobdellovibrionaceae bacterium]
MKKLLISLMAFFTCSQVFAYVTATYGNDGTNPNVRTHVIIVGRGNDLGTLFQISSAAKAKKYADLYPNEQVYLISVNETSNQNNLDLLKNLGYRNINETSDFTFVSNDVQKEMSKFKKIASVDIFSHSVAYYGVILDGKLHRMDPKKDGYEKLAGNFTPDAFAVLHGCNSGQFLAPVLSKQWGIPVAGSFTFTDFQKLHDSGNFYFDDNRKPSTGSSATVNKVSYQRNELCSEGACRRLYPNNFAYDGYWGVFTEGGLGFYKFFCMQNSEDVCYKAMARAAISSVSVKAVNLNSSFEDYKAVVIDWMCPLSATSDIRQKCIAGLDKAVATGGTYDSYDGKSIQCSFKGCDAKFKCQRLPLIDLLRAGSCEVINLRPSAKTTTQVNEYKGFLKGWKLLQAEKGK